MTADARRLAHDLNNIAFIIGGYAQRLEETIDKNDPRREDVDQILAAVPKLSEVRQARAHPARRGRARGARAAASRVDAPWLSGRDGVYWRRGHGALRIARAARSADH